VAIIASSVAIVIALIVLCVAVSTTSVKQNDEGLFTDYESAETINEEVLKDETEVIKEEPKPEEFHPVEELEPEEYEEPEIEEKPAKEEKAYSMQAEFYAKAANIQSYSDSIDWGSLNQSQMNINSGEVFDKWDALLNDVYQHLKKTKSKSEFEAIKKDELRWIKEKEKAIDAEAKMWEGGSGAPAATNGVATTYTKDRCYYLISLVD